MTNPKTDDALDSPPSGPGVDRTRLLYFVFSLVFTALPFWIVDIPPIADLPQHVAQIRIATEHFAGLSDLYVFQWWTPYTLSSAVLGLLWPLGDPLLVGKIGFCLFSLAWVTAIHLVARRYDVAPLGAVLASVFVFNDCLYWGFSAFYVGFPVFVLWVWLVERTYASESARPLCLVAVALCAVGLYASHVLWLAGALVWMTLEGLRRGKLRTTALAVAVCLPLVLVTLAWYPSLGERGFDSVVTLGPLPTARISLRWMTQLALGVVAGPTPSVMLLTVLFFALARGFRNGISERASHLLSAGVVLGLFAVFLPMKVQLTILFDGRWLPVSMVFITLGLFGAAKAGPRAQATALLVTIAFYLNTAFAWWLFEETELDGLVPALEAVEIEDPRVLGLDFRRRSTVLDGGGFAYSPFLQMHAWVQARNGGIPNFSFAEMAPLPFVYRSDFERPWTRNLEWSPGSVSAEDIALFDYVLVNANDLEHEGFGAQHGLETVTGDGHWRLYRGRRRRP